MATGTAQSGIFPLLIRPRPRGATALQPFLGERAVVAPEFARLFRGLAAQALLGEAHRMGYHTACSRLNAVRAWKARASSAAASAARLMLKASARSQLRLSRAVNSSLGSNATRPTGVS